MIRNKFVISTFLFFAWAVIFAHSIVPHHHHQDFVISECSDCHDHEAQFVQVVELHNCDDNCQDPICHFHVEIVRQVTLDNYFVLISDIVDFNDFLSIEEDIDGFVAEFISDQIPKTNYLRGPPSIS